MVYYFYTWVECKAARDAAGGAFYSAELQTAKTSRCVEHVLLHKYDTLHTTGYTGLQLPVFVGTPGHSNDVQVTKMWLKKEASGSIKL